MSPNRRLRLGLVALAVVCPSTVLAETPKIDRVGPPSWWSDSEPRTVTLLIEGAGFSGLSVLCDRPEIAVGDVRETGDGHYLFVDLALPAGVAPGKVGLQIKAQESTSRIDWEVVPRPARRPQPLGQDDVIYLVMPDRFADGFLTPGAAMLDRKDPHSYHGGDFAGLKARLPYLADLGVTALWLTPVYRQADRFYETTVDGKPRKFADFHGYSAVDFYDTNPRLGTLSEYKTLVDEAHRLGLKIIQDQLLGFTGPQHPWVKRPPTPAWFHGPIDRPLECNFRFDALVNPHARESDRKGLTDGWFFGILPDLNMRDPKVARYAIQQSLWWTVLYENDAIRLDTYPMVDRSFWQVWSRELAKIAPEVRSIGEAWVLDPADLAFFQGGRAGWDGIDPGVPMVFDFPLFTAITDVITNRRSATRLAKAIAKDGVYPHPEWLVTFLDNHDTDRLASAPKVSPARHRLAASFLLTTRGIPQITWGSEIGLEGGSNDRRTIPGGFPGDTRDAFMREGRTSEEQRVFSHYRDLIDFRKHHPALRRGNLIDVLVTDSIYAFERAAEGERLFIVLNFGSKTEKTTVKRDLIASESATNLFGPGSATRKPDHWTVESPPESMSVFALDSRPVGAK